MNYQLNTKKLQVLKEYKEKLIEFLAKEKELKENTKELENSKENNKTNKIEITIASICNLLYVIETLILFMVLKSSSIATFSFFKFFMTIIGFAGNVLYAEYCFNLIDKALKKYKKGLTNTKNLEKSQKELELQKDSLFKDLELLISKDNYIMNTKVISKTNSNKEVIKPNNNFENVNSKNISNKKLVLKSQRVTIHSCKK